MGRTERLLAVIGLSLAAVTAQARDTRDLVVVGLMADRAILKVDGETHLLKLGESFDDITLLRVNASEALLRVGKREQVFTLGQDRAGGSNSPTSATVTSSASNSSTATSAEKAEESSGKAAVEISLNMSNAFETSGMINGRVVHFVVDTGASLVSMTRGQAQRLGIDFRRFGKPGMNSTANGVVRSWRVLLDRVKVGPITVMGVEASVIDNDADIPVLLGMSFLSRVNMEHVNQRLRLTAK